MVKAAPFRCSGLDAAAIENLQTAGSEKGSAADALCAARDND
jgi:hypothetical protein